MIVAQLQITTSAPMALHGHVWNIGFSDAEEAQQNYELIAQLIDDREQRKNGIPFTVEIEATGARSTFIVADLRSVSLSDLAECNAHEAGMADAYPLLHRTPKR